MNRRIALTQLVLTALAACAGAEGLRKGDLLVEQGDYAGAVTAYERVLAADPDNETALTRRGEARCRAAERVLGEVENALRKEAYTEALAGATLLRRMPVSLNEVSLVSRIEATVSHAASVAEQHLAKMLERGHFLPALALCEQIEGVAAQSRRFGARRAEILASAVAHYRAEAARFEERGLWGGATLRWAAAARLGSTDVGGRLKAARAGFFASVCPREPVPEVVDASGEGQRLLAPLRKAVAATLAGLFDACGRGQLSVAVQIVLQHVHVTHEVRKEAAAKALPGVGLVTERTEEVEEPYTTLEEVREDEIRLEKREERDCAPRPGKQRKCRTRLKEVAVKIPVLRQREVRKVRRVTRLVPIPPETFPADQVVRHEQLRETNVVEVAGRIRIRTETGSGRGRPFEIIRASSDVGHDEVQDPRLLVPRDPLEALALEQVCSQAAEGVAAEVGRAVMREFEALAERTEIAAREGLHAGRKQEAEEGLLRALVLRGKGTKEAEVDFLGTHGLGADDVLALLVGAPGSEESTAATGESASSGVDEARSSARSHNAAGTGRGGAHDRIDKDP